MVYDMKLDAVPFALIKDGVKSVEIRLYDDKRRQIKAGDSVRFTCVQTGENIAAEVVSVRKFDSFLAVFKSDLFGDCGFKGTPEQAVGEMYKYYTREEEVKYGVAAICLKSTNIYSKGKYPADVLSNFSHNQFVIDGVLCGSMEGFLQSLKYRSAKKQRRICALYGKTAKEKGRHKFWWKVTGNVRWQGKKIKRQSKEFDELIRRAYACLFTNPEFVKALKEAKGGIIAHSIGKTDKRKTILTKQEFTDNLYALAERL